LNLKRLASLFVLFALLFSMVASASAQYGTEAHKVVVDLAHETAHAGDFENVPEILEAMGYTVEVVTDEITADVLSDADMILIPVPMGVSYSEAELNALETWFDSGNKAVWIAGDSDFDGADYIPATNTILHKLGSHIMLENNSVEEPNEAYNDGAAYRVVASNWNSAHPITEGVAYETFHGPTFLYGVKDGNPVNLYTESIDNVDWIAASSDSSVAVDAQLTGFETPGVEAGSNGPFVLMAVEERTGADESSKIVVSAEAIFSSYKNMNMDGPSEKENFTIDGGTLLENTLTWMGQESEEESSNTMLYLGVGVVVIIIIVGAAYAMMKK